MCTALRYGRPNARHSSRRLVAMELQHVDGHRVEHRPHLGGDPDRRTARRGSRTAAARRRSRAPAPTSTNRGVPRQNTRPIASAPASAAARPSATRVMPQILIRVRIVLIRERRRPRASPPAPWAAARIAHRSRPRRDTARRRRTWAPRACGRAPASNSASHSALSLPAPTRTSAPTMLRTMWCRKALAENSKRTKGPCCVTSMRVSVLTGDFAWHSAARNAEKSCVPSKLARGGIHRRRVERMMVPAGAAGEQRGPFRAHQQQVGVVAGRCGKARMEVLGNRMRPQHRGRGRQVGVDAADPRGIRTLRIRFEMDDLRHGVHAGIGAPGSGHGDRHGRRFRRIARSSASCTPQPDGCDWKPQNAWPEYSTARAKRMAGIGIQESAAGKTSGGGSNDPPPVDVT